MLIEFRVGNFRSFKEEQILSMVAGNRDSSHLENLFPHRKFKLLKTAAVYGANASGKSNLVKAIGSMARFIRDSVPRMGPEDKIPCASPFRLSADTIKEPSTFEVTIIEDGVRHQYGFSVTGERVIKEWLTTYPLPPKRRQDQLCREYQSEKGEYDWSFRPHLSKEADEELLRDKTRPNQLALSRAADLSIEPFASLFSSLNKNLQIVETPEDTPTAFRKAAEFAERNPSYLQDVQILLRHADMGIDGITITKEEIPLGSFPTEPPKNTPDEMKPVALSFLSMWKEIAKIAQDPAKRHLIPAYAVRTNHHILGADEPIQFNLLSDESDGTRCFFELAGPILSALYNGNILVVDEIDRSLHPLLTRKLIELFHSPTANPKGAQLIFATHDCSLMTPDLFRRDQLWLVDKNREGASEMFSLYDFDTKDRPRDKTAFRNNYLAGRYGGIPNLGPMEDMEISAIAVFTLLLPTPPLGDAVTFGYRPESICLEWTSTTLFVYARRRTRQDR